MKNAWLLLIILALLILPIAYYLLSPLWRTVEMQEASPLMQAPAQDGVMPILLAEGQFVPSAHEVQGKALLIQEKDAKTLRLEDFETVNGPDLHIWLASSLDGKDYIDLGPLKATKGNVNYAVPADVDTEKYNNVLVWCVPFRVLFSYAELE